MHKWHNVLPSSTHLDDSRPKAILACYVVVSTFQLGQVAKTFLRLANTQSVSSSVCMHGVRFEEVFLPKTKVQNLQCCSYRIKKYLVQKRKNIIILKCINIKHIIAKKFWFRTWSHSNWFWNFHRGKTQGCRGMQSQGRACRNQWASAVSQRKRPSPKTYF